MKPGKAAPAPVVDETRETARLIFDRIHGAAEARAQTPPARTVGGTKLKRATATMKVRKPAD